MVQNQNTQVLIIDLADSRKMTKEQRQEAQDQMGTALFHFNAVHQKKAADFRGGDGMVFICDGRSELITTLNMVREFVKFPFHVGVGEGEVFIKGDSPNAMYGSAFHAAADSLKRAKEWVVRGLPPRIFCPADTHFERKLNEKN